MQDGSPEVQEAALDECCSNKGAELERLARQADQRRVLVIVLVVNALMFGVEFSAGIVAGSAALMADAVDMLGDAVVYGLSLYALDRSSRWKAGAALTKGGFILLLGLGVVYELGIKLVTGVTPMSELMLLFGAIALITNTACLALLWRFRGQDVNMSSTFECSRNDVIANIGVIIAGLGVMQFNSIWPDVIVATLIAVIFFRSAFVVLSEAYRALKQPVQERAAPPT